MINTQHAIKFNNNEDAIFSWATTLIENKAIINPVYPNSHDNVQNIFLSNDSTILKKHNAKLYISIVLSDQALLVHLKVNKKYDFILSLKDQKILIKGLFLIQMSTSFISNQIVLELLFDSEPNNDELTIDNTEIGTIQKQKIKIKHINEIRCISISHKKDVNNISYRYDFNMTSQIKIADEHGFIRDKNYAPIKIDVDNDKSPLGNSVLIVIIIEISSNDGIKYNLGHML